MWCSRAILLHLFKRLILWLVLSRGFRNKFGRTARVKRWALGFQHLAFCIIQEIPKQVRNDGLELSVVRTANKFGMTA